MTGQMSLGCTRRAAELVGLIVVLFFSVSAQVSWCETPDDTIVIYSEMRHDTEVFYLIDLAEGGVSEPTEIVHVTAPEGATRVVGLFNGTLYFRYEKNRLIGVELGTANVVALDTPLASNARVEDGLVYHEPEGESGAWEIIDLRKRSRRSGRLDDGAEKDWILKSRSHNGFLRLFQAPKDASESDAALACRIVDLREEDHIPLDFQLTVPAPSGTWRISSIPDASSVSLNYQRLPAFDPSFAWQGDEQFACIAMALTLDGTRYPSDENKSELSLFVVDREDRSVAVLPLTSPATGTRSEFGHPASGFADVFVDLDSMTQRLADGYQTGRLARFEEGHFSITKGNGTIQVARGDHSLGSIYDTAPQRYVMSPSGEAVILRDTSYALHDIYAGSYRSFRRIHSMDFSRRSELSHQPFSPQQNRPFVRVDEGIPSCVFKTSGLADHVYGAGREARDATWSFQAETQPNRIEPGETVLVELTLQNISEAPVWTDPPTIAYGNVVGTLVDRDKIRDVGEFRAEYHTEDNRPVLLEPGASLVRTVAIDETLEGAYSLALAYRGSDSVQWYGRVRAPVVEFVVGTLPQDPRRSRLEKLVRDAVLSKGPSDRSSIIKELGMVREEAIPVIVAFLRETPLPPEGATGLYKRRYFSSLYRLLRDYRDVTLIPFFAEAAKSSEFDVEAEGIWGLAKIYRATEDAELKKRVENEVRAALRDKPLKARSLAIDHLGDALWPNFYEELKLIATSEDEEARNEALFVLNRKYIWKRSEFEGDTRTFAELSLNSSNQELRRLAFDRMVQLHHKMSDAKSAARYVDDYRIQYPEAFPSDGFRDFPALRDMYWLRRVADDPTESRFQLLEPLFGKLEAHCGIQRPANFPTDWKAHTEDGDMREAFAETVRKWADCIETSPASFAIPSVSP